ncbi:hypothetical protein [Palleronia sp. LCG004]|uniref:hypothetical protein n=1 Tax=Palleronia sp. LCG004 TaxID=3079304 RepID=UPI002943F4E4|nr:hypothetical protein [Palleronia sp. LCG004]WOI58407.1 hypothetical protein RVY76_18150 [Palleronia sp. LCG004]
MTKLEEITVEAFVILSEDDKRHPLELPILEERVAKIASDASVYVVSETDRTNGHGATCNSSYYAEPLEEFLGQLPNAP